MRIRIDDRIVPFIVKITVPASPSYHDYYQQKRPDECTLYIFFSTVHHSMRIKRNQRTIGVWKMWILDVDIWNVAFSKYF